MRFVPIKTDDQLDLQAIHRVRDRLIARRTSVINELRAFLLERGMTFAKTPFKLKVAMPDILENAEANLTPRMRNLVSLLWSEWKDLELVGMNEEIEQIASSDSACRRLRQIPGIGPLVATAIVAAIGNGAAFHKGREFSSWLGLVPRQHSTGGKAKLFGISKRGRPILALAAAEAENLGRKQIGTEHLLLGVLREEKSLAAQTLNECGVRLSFVREQLSSNI